MRFSTAEAILAAGIHVADHGIVIFLNDTGVPINLPYRPWADDAGTSPGGCTMTVEYRSLVTEQALPVLRVHQVHHPLGEVSGHILVVASRPDEDLGVPRPAKALVALRAIGGHFQIVGALPPDDIAVDLVHHGVRALKGTGLGGIRVEHNARDGIRSRLFPEARDLHIAEAVEGEFWLPDFLPASFEEVGVHCACGAQVDGVGGAILLEHLAKDHIHPVAGLAFDLEACPA